MAIFRIPILYPELNHARVPVSKIVGLPTGISGTAKRVTIGESRPPGIRAHCEVQKCIVIATSRVGSKKPIERDQVFEEVLYVTRGGQKHIIGGNIIFTRFASRPPQSFYNPSSQYNPPRAVVAASIEAMMTTVARFLARKCAGRFIFTDS